jgi:hypothetical protein
LHSAQLRAGCDDAILTRKAHHLTTSLAKEHPELFHYTGIAGLEGIIKSQTLRATHPAFLNDAMEFRAFEARLAELLRSPSEKFLVNSVERAQANKALIEQRGGMEKATEELMAGIVTGIYNTLLGTSSSPAYIGLT